MKKIGLIIGCVCLFLAACESGQHFAPVTDIANSESIPASGVHHVVHGESLYEIAWRYGMDYRVLAERNNMHSPYTLYTGQRIYLYGQKPIAVTRTVPAPAPQPIIKTAAAEPAEPHFSTAAWLRPAKGPVIRGFSALNKGIDIGGAAGTPIYATAAGKVVYAGSGLRGYGNLIIIKHNNLYLSAYAHNEALLVQEGQWVKKGQKIAEMGDTGSDKVNLHFEIRKAGQPVNPLTLIAV